MPSIAPVLLPWLGPLALLILKSNRGKAAWLIFLPLVCVTAITLAPLPSLPAGMDFALDIVGALAVGLAAVWLLSDHLRRRHRWLTFLGVLVVLGGFSGLDFLLNQGGNWMTGATPQAAVVLGSGILALAAALLLSGLVCRGRYRPLGIYAWSFLVLGLAWLLLVAPFFVIALLSGAGGIDWSEMMVAVLTVTIVTYATLLPFLILSSAAPFFRERLKALLHVKPVIPPPLSTAATG